MADLIEFLVMTKDSDGIKGLGTHSFRIAPRTGEFVILDDGNHIGQAYRVKAVIHPLDFVGTAGDLILEHVGTDVEMRMSV
jgi:hypothetical protein